MPFIVPNFIVLGQTMWKKTRYKMFYTLQYFGGLGPKFTNLGPDVQKPPFYEPAKFRRFR